MQPIQPLFDTLRQCMDTFPDYRTGANGQYRMADFGMAAFAPFFMQSPSFLAHQRRIEQGHGRSNQSLFGMTKIPKDNQIRKMLDPVSPSHLFPVFNAIRSRLQRSSGHLDAFLRLGDHVLIALDGTEYFYSDKLHCENCSTRKRKNGKIEYFHAMLAATLVAPGHDKSLPPRRRGSFRSNPSSLCHRTALTNRTARTGRRNGGWPPTDRIMLRSSPSTSATASLLVLPLRCLRTLLPPAIMRSRANRWRTFCWPRSDKHRGEVHLHVQAVLASADRGIYHWGRTSGP